MDTNEDTMEIITIDDDIWEELIEITDSAAGPCFQCGVCTATCPWGLVREQPLTVRTLMRNAQLGTLEDYENIWTCTTCKQCEASCPRGVPIAEVFRGLRYMLWKRRELLEGLPSALWSVYWNNNPWFQPPSQRMLWADGIDPPIFDAKKHELLLYVGCTSSYDRRAQKIARSLIKIMDASGIHYGILGEDEPCCGEAVLSLGHQPYFEEVAQQAAAKFSEQGVRVMVTVSPHCFDVFHNHYSDLNGEIEVLHYTQILNQWIQGHRSKLESPINKTVTFHDPCYLGRWNQVYDPPRNILSSIPDLSLVEMESHGPEALCCGGGGGRMWVETKAGERFSDLRVQEAARSGANVIATACPFCIACLEDSLKAQDMHEMIVLDIAEIVAKSITE